MKFPTESRNTIYEQRLTDGNLQDAIYKKVKGETQMLISVKGKLM